MKSSDFSHRASDGKELYVRRWLPSGTPKALLLIAHGMAEHSARYERLAAAMTSAGWLVIAPDHRGHGKTAAGGELGWLAKSDGFSRLRDDLHEVAQAASAEYAGIPLFLLGHSLGSLIAEGYIRSYGKELGGCVLSGVLTPPSFLLFAVARAMAGLGVAFKGAKAPAKILHKLSFEANNKDFAPARSPLDWLSRDSAEVDKYIADPLCGFVCSFGFYRDLFSGFSSVYAGGLGSAGIVRSLPVLILAGAEDPLGGALGFVSQLAGQFKAAGLQDVSTRLYPGARHEILNETNRDEVVGDILSWLEAKAAKA